MAGARRLQRLSLLDRVAAHPAGRARARSSTRGLDFYDRLVDGLIGARHHALAVPLSLGSAAGAPGRAAAGSIATSPSKFADYARVVGAPAAATASSTGRCSTSQRPRAVRLLASAAHAPGLTGLANMLARQPHQNLAHGRALSGAAGASARSCGSAPCLAVSRCGRRSESAEDRRAAERFDAFWNGAFLDPLFKGVYPRRGRRRIRRRRSPRAISKVIRQPIDFFGRQLLRAACTSPSAATACSARGSAPCRRARASPRWAGRSMPAGSTKCSTGLRDHYGDPEVYVTENGACYDDRVDADGTRA